MYFILLGLSINNLTEIHHAHEVTITFWCPMRFQWYPLDQQICKFRIGSYAFDKTKMRFRNSIEEYDYSQGSSNTILDYSVEILPLNEKDTFIMRKGNYSLAGFEMRLKRNFLKYFLNYYLPSGLFVMVSWVKYMFFVINKKLMHKGWNWCI